MPEYEINGDICAIVSAYLSHNVVAATEIPVVIKSVHDALIGLGKAATPLPLPEPAVHPKKSVHPDHLVCLDCGAKMKMLTRHVRLHGLTPDEYRARWGLPASYPMVADGYSKLRSQMAKSFGLGHKRKGKK